MYQTQCPSIYNRGMSTDIDLLHIIAVGKEINYDYLQHLVDVYDRERVALLRKTKDE